jgi:hypothetical protein
LCFLWFDSSGIQDPVMPAGISQNVTEAASWISLRVALWIG